MGSDHDDSDICLGDFGLSKFVAPQQHMTEACGTVCYAAPELLEGKKYDKKVDAWSVGCLLYLMLIGGLPFYTSKGSKESKDQIILQKILHDEPSFKYIGWKDVPTEAIDLIKKFLTKNPSRRISVSAALNDPWIAKCPITPIPSPIMIATTPLPDDDIEETIDEFSEVRCADFYDSFGEPLHEDDVNEFRSFLNKAGYQVIPTLTGTLFECIGKFLEPAIDDPEEFCRQKLPSKLRETQETAPLNSLINSIGNEIGLQLIIFKLVARTLKQILKTDTAACSCKLLYYNRNNLLLESSQNGYCILNDHSSHSSTPV